MHYYLDCYDIKNPDQSLSVIQCGYQECHSGYKSLPRRYNDYSVTFVLEGKGCYTLNNIQYELSAGQGFIIFPDMPVTYSANANAPWKYIYAIFKGVDCDSLIHNSGLSHKQPFFTFPSDESFLQLLQAMHTAGKVNKAMGYDVTGYFLLVMSRLITETLPNKKIANIQEEYMDLALAYIENHYPYHMNVSDIAKHINIDRTYLYRLFKQQYNMSPVQFLNEYRLSKAVKMMDHCKMTLNEIALSTGFSTPAHFNRAFSKRYGMPPGQYRLLNDNQ